MSADLAPAAATGVPVNRNRAPDLAPAPATIYLPDDPPWKPRVLQTLAAQALLRTVPAADACLRAGPAIVGGLARGSLDVMRAARVRRAETGEPYLFVDRAYFNGGHQYGAAHPNPRYRFVWNAYQHHAVDARRAADLRRFERTGLRLEAWRRGGRHVLVCPPATPEVCALFNLFTWADDTLQRLRQLTDRPLRVRPKGDPTPLMTDLADAHAVVTPLSTVAISAALAGVPVFVHAESAAAPVGSTDLDRIETPARGDRALWAAALAWGQFEMSEIASGVAWGVLKEDVTP